MNHLRTIETHFQRLLLRVACLLAVGIVIVLMIQVLGRYVLTYPYPWPEEVAGFMFVWLIFIGVPAAYRRGVIIGIDWLAEMMPPRMRYASRIFTDVVVLAVLALLVWKGIEATLAASRTQTTVLRFSWAWIYASFPIGCLLLAYSVLLDLSDHIRDTRASEGARTTPKVL